MHDKPQTTELNYSGFIELKEWGEAYDILFLSTMDDPLVEKLHDEISGENVTCRYWISDKECSKDEAEKDALYTIMGAAETDFGSRYSEITGYLWTYEVVKIGGHDLVRELSSRTGKYLHLEIKVHS